MVLTSVRDQAGRAILTWLLTVPVGEPRAYLPEGLSRGNLRNWRQSSKCIVCTRSATWHRAPSQCLTGSGAHGSHPFLPSWGLTQKAMHSTPRPQSLSTTLQCPLCHPLALRRGTTSHLYANYFATWTEVIMLSDRKLTGLKSKMEMSKLTGPSARQEGHAHSALPGQPVCPGGSRPVNSGSLRAHLARAAQCRARWTPARKGPSLLI